MTLNIAAMWDFSQPEVSEQRFRAALPTASTTDVLILQTQIARAYGLRRDFAQARQILSAIELEINQAPGEAQVRYYLELGRTYAYATHSPESQTTEERELARSAYLRAVKLAQAAGLDGLAVDALHMMTFVDTSPEEQIRWNQEAIDLMEASEQESARKWAGALHNNMGYALQLSGQYEAALQEFRLALAAHEQGGNPTRVRIAHWMIAWTLRSLDRLDEALEIQLRLEKEWDAAGSPDPYVFEELALLYSALGDQEKAAYYTTRREAGQ